ARHALNRGPRAERRGGEIRAREGGVEHTAVNTEQRRLAADARLALDLTSLANERTFLTYVRTALAFFATGAALIRFFDNPAFVITGWLFIPAGIALGVFGGARFRRVRRMSRAKWALASMEPGELRGSDVGDERG
ncbi:MAG TPA: DUF202 domain-containing protein, partial [Gemmatimonadaceae bacterium]